MRDLVDGTLDLFLGSRCSACDAPGRALCRSCRSRLPTSAGPCWPTPTPPGLVRPSAAAPYAGAVRSLVLDHKEHGRLALARPLGALLALAVLDACAAVPDGSGSPGRVDLIPVPSHPAVVRARGHDPVLRMARVAAARARRAGLPAGVRRLLRVAERPADQAGLTAEERAANVAGRFAVRGRPLGGAGPRAWVVLVDDVITTGATVREAQRALEAAGIHPAGAAAVAATRRNRPPPGAARARPECPVGHVSDPALT